MTHNTSGAQLECIPEECAHDDAPFRHTHTRTYTHLLLRSIAVNKIDLFTFRKIYANNVSRAASCFAMLFTFRPLRLPERWDEILGSRWHENTRTESRVVGWLFLQPQQHDVC